MFDVIFKFIEFLFSFPFLIAELFEAFLNDLLTSRSQEQRSAAIQDLDDDTVSVQSQDTDKQPETPSSSLSKSSNDSKESTPQPVDVKKVVKEPSVEKTTPEQEKKVNTWRDFKLFSFF